MTVYKLSEKDYSLIYEHAVREFTETAMHTNYTNFLTICIVNSFLTYTRNNHLVINKGEVYVGTESQTTEN